MNVCDWLERLPLAGLSSLVYECAVRTGAYPIVEYIIRAPDLPANIRLGWKGLKGTHNKKTLD